MSEALISEEHSDISPREDARGGAGGGSGSCSKSNLATGESLPIKITPHCTAETFNSMKTNLKLHLT